MATSENQLGLVIAGFTVSLGLHAGLVTVFAYRGDTWGLHGVEVASRAEDSTLLVFPRERGDLAAVPPPLAEMPAGAPEQLPESAPPAPEPPPPVPAPKLEPKPEPQPEPIPEPKPELQPEVMPPEPPQAPEVRPGIDGSLNPDSRNWLGFREEDKKRSIVSTVEQSSLSPNPGEPAPLGGAPGAGQATAASPAASESRSATPDEVKESTDAKGAEEQVERAPLQVKAATIGETPQPVVAKPEPAATSATSQDRDAGVRPISGGGATTDGGTVRGGEAEPSGAPEKILTAREPLRAADAPPEADGREKAPKIAAPQGPKVAAMPTAADAAVMESAKAPPVNDVREVPIDEAAKVAARSREGEGAGTEASVVSKGTTPDAMMKDLALPGQGRAADEPVSKASQERGEGKEASGEAEAKVRDLPRNAKGELIVPEPPAARTEQPLPALAQREPVTAPQAGEGPAAIEDAGEVAERSKVGDETHAAEMMRSKDVAQSNADRPSPAQAISPPTSEMREVPVDAREARLPQAVLEFMRGTLLDLQPKQRPMERKMRPSAGASAASPAPSAAGVSVPGTRQGIQSDAEAVGAVIEDVKTYVLGANRVAAGEGIEVFPSPPRFSLQTQYVAKPKNPNVYVIFGRDGTVLKADFVDKKGTGWPDVDGPLIEALYRWTAKGTRLRALPPPDPKRPEATGLMITFRMLLRPEGSP